VVECFLAKEDVASSNLVSRSTYLLSSCTRYPTDLRKIPGLSGSSDYSQQAGVIQGPEKPSKLLYAFSGSSDCAVARNISLVDVKEWV
jgi:hypothetical protein